MDPITQFNLVTIRIEDLRRERQLLHEAGARRYGGPVPVPTPRPTWTTLYRRLRRRLGALLIQAGRRLGDGARPPEHPAYGSARR